MDITKQHREQQEAKTIAEQFPPVYRRLSGRHSSQ